MRRYVDVPISPRQVWVPPKTLPGTDWAHCHTPSKRRGSLWLSQPHERFPWSTRDHALNWYWLVLMVLPATGIDWGNPVTPSIYLTQFCVFLGTASCLAISPLFYMDSQPAQPCWMEEISSQSTVRSLGFGGGSAGETSHMASVHSSGQKQSCACWMCLRKSRTNSKQARPCWAQQREAVAQPFTVHFLWGNLGASRTAEREKLLKCFWPIHEKSSTCYPLSSTYLNS